MNAMKNSHIATILVTSAGRGSAISIIRALGRAGYRVIAADSIFQSLGFRSRFAYKSIIYPSPENYPQRFVEYLLKIVKVQDVKLLIPVTDLEILPIIAARDLFESITCVALPANNLLEMVNDKIKTFQLAKKVGVPVPKTFIAKNSEDALKLSKELSWPVVVKPQYSKKILNGNKIVSFGVDYAQNPNELVRLMRSLEQKCDVLLQSYQPGVGYGIEILTRKGEPLAAFAHRRLREIPVTGGASCYRQSIKLDKTLYSNAVHLMKELDWTGVAMVEFKVNGSDTWLMEINGRVWGSLPLAYVSGVNFPLMLTELFLNGGDMIKKQLSNNYKIGLRCRDLGKDLMWIISVMTQRKSYSFFPMPKRSRAVRAIMGLLNPLRKFDLFCLDDPMPAIAELPAIYRKFRIKMHES
jgi:predicted ATP-grasp superfamily ATP-dependent carboligase